MSSKKDIEKIDQDTKGPGHISAVGFGKVANPFAISADSKVPTSDILENRDTRLKDIYCSAQALATVEEVPEAIRTALRALAIENRLTSIPKMEG